MDLGQCSELPSSTENKGFERLRANCASGPGLPIICDEDRNAALGVPLRRHGACAFCPARHLSVRDCSSLHLRLVRGATQAPIFSTLLYDDVDGPPYALILYQTFLALLAIGCVIVADKNAAAGTPIS